MKTKKLLALFLALAVIGATIMGCGGGSSNGGGGNAGGDAAEGGEAGGAQVSEDGSTTVTSNGEYSADNPYHLTFAYVELYQQDDAARQAVQDALNDYMIPKYHMEVEFMPLQFAEYQNKIQLMFTGGDAVDVIPVYYTNASSWIAMNGIVDMSPYMSTPEGQAIIDAIGEENAWVGRMGDTLFGFPASKESVELGGLAMRADICDELGITEEYGLSLDGDAYTGKIYDWDVATEIFAKVHEVYPNMTVLYLQGSSSPMRRFAFFDELADQFGVLDWESDHDSTTVVNEFETEAYKKAVTRLAEWFDAGYIYKDALTDQQGYTTMVKAGNTFAYATAIKPGWVAEAQAQNGIDMYPMYFGNYVEGGISTTNVSFFDTGIATNSEDPDMAFKFISALYTDPVVMNLWQNGIEDVNYQVLDDGTAYYAEGEDSQNYKYHMNTGWMLGNQFISYVWQDEFSSKTTEYWDKLAHHNDWADYSPAFGFMWDSSAYSTQITALQNALETYRPALETGSVGGAANVESVLQQLNDALYAADLQDVMDAKQEQLNAWLAENGPTQNPEINDQTINSVDGTVIGAE